MKALFGGGPTRKYNRAEKKVEKAVAKVGKAKSNFVNVEKKIISKLEKGANRILARQAAKNKK